MTSVGTVPASFGLLIWVLFTAIFYCLLVAEGSGSRAASSGSPPGHDQGHHRLTLGNSSIIIRAMTKPVSGHHRVASGGYWKPLSDVIGRLLEQAQSSPIVSLPYLVSPFSPLPRHVLGALLHSRHQRLPISVFSPLPRHTKPPQWMVMQFCCEITSA